MTIVFVVDTSASMNQRCANGLTLLDCAKSAVEHFVKQVRLRDGTWHRTDRYILATTEDNAIKVIDRYPYTNFTRAVKSLEAHDLTQIGSALQQVFDYLHLQRLANDTDKYGLGRNPCAIEPTTIVLLTDGTELSCKTGVLKTITPSGTVPLGGELAARPFRWDQRVFATVLRIPSVSQQVLDRSGPFSPNAPISGLQTAVAMDNDISAFCESTGGKCYIATSWKVLLQNIDVTSRLSTCVVVSFENIPISGSSALPLQVHAACLRKLLFVKANQPHHGHWPIPEAYWPEPGQTYLPPRDPHPIIAYKAIDSDPAIPAQFLTYDKYDVESNPIASFLLKASRDACWQVFIRNSKGPNNGYGDPFGYLRLDRLGNTLNLYVLPYNYPVLWQLLEQVVKNPRVTNTAQWRQDMERYCNSIPSYYGPPLRNALRQWGLTMHIVPESLEKSLYGGFVGNQLKRLKLQAKTEWENLTEKAWGVNISNSKPLERILPAVKTSATDTIPAAHKFTTSTYSVRLGSSNEGVLIQKQIEVPIPCGPTSQGSKVGSTADVPKPGNENNMTGNVPIKESAIFKNPFDIPREDLLRQLKYLPIRVALAMDARTTSTSGGVVKHSAFGSMAARFVAKEEEEARHSLPIEKMGDFGEAFLRQQPPRNPFADEQERTKQQRLLFGNPYRQEKNDAADEKWLGSPLGSSEGALFRGRKRRRRPDSPSVSGTSVSSGESNAILSGSSEVTSLAKNGKASENKLKEVAVVPDMVDNVVQATSGTVGEPETIGEPVVTVQTSSSVHQQEETSQTSKRRKLSVSSLANGRASEFVLTALRALRHANSHNDRKLFELLSAPEIPVDKAHLVEQLIRQAECYKKHGIASKLKQVVAS